jgi:phthiocerol/phenolphthiocerol synthesis type-I polyketide synthase E
VLLTGATGFVGAFLCAELLRATDAEVHCLVRAGDAAEGAERIRRKLASFGLLTDAVSRIVAVPGDLAQPLLGLSGADFAALADKVDAIYHCGAWVNFVRPYQVLKPANVLGTQEILRLATRVRRTPVHHISTLAVLAGAFVAKVPVVTEDAELPPPVGHDTGYSESKWVAEGLVTLARGRGVPVSTYRPGVVLGDRRSGVSNGEDYLTMMIQGCVQLGLAPLREYSQPAATVDFVSRAVVALSLRPDTIGRTFHVVGEEPLAWNQMFEHVRAFGYQVPSVPYAQWRQALAEQLERSPDNALAALEGMLAEEADRQMARVDCGNLLAGLAGRSGKEALAAGELDADFFAAVLGYFVRSGWLAPPAAGQPGQPGQLEQLGQQGGT